MDSWDDDESEFDSEDDEEETRNSELTMRQDKGKSHIETKSNSGPKWTSDQTIERVEHLAKAADRAAQLAKKDPQFLMGYIAALLETVIENQLDDHTQEILDVLRGENKDFCVKVWTYRESPLPVSIVQDDED